MIGLDRFPQGRSCLSHGLQHHQRFIQVRAQSQRRQLFFQLHAGCSQLHLLLLQFLGRAVILRLSLGQLRPGGFQGVFVAGNLGTRTLQRSLAAGELLPGILQRYFILCDLGPGILQLDLVLRDLGPGVLQLGLVLCDLGPGVLQFLFAVGDLRLCVVDLRLRICNFHLCISPQGIIAQGSPLLGKGLELIQIGGFPILIRAGIVIDAIQHIAVNISRGIASAVIISVKRLLSKGDKVVIGSQTRIARSPGILRKGGAIVWDIEDGRHHKGVIQQAAVMGQSDGIPYLDALIHCQSLLQRHLAAVLGKRTFQYGGKVHGLLERTGLHQDLLFSRVKEHRIGVPSLHGLDALPAGNGLDILVGHAIGTGDFQGLQVFFGKVKVRSLLHSNARGLKALEYRNAHRGNYKHGDKGNAALFNAPQEMLPLGLLHYHTNSFALAGWRFTITSDTTPPFMRITRLAILAISSLWVTIKRVVPAWITSSSTVSTSMLVS